MLFIITHFSSSDFILVESPLIPLAGNSSMESRSPLAIFDILDEGAVLVFRGLGVGFPFRLQFNRKEQSLYNYNKTYPFVRVPFGCLLSCSI